MVKNNLKKIRESLMISKAELARKANISPITITRIEQGMPCRMETKRKILLALGLKISDEKKVFGEDMELSIKNKKERRLVYDRRRISYDMFIPERRSVKNRRNGPS
ncbi:MAG: helix-turn-helix transcriptional regulator [Desulfobacterales bacterium]